MNKMVLTLTLITTVLLGSGCAVNRAVTEQQHRDCLYVLGLTGATAGGGAGALPGIVIGAASGAALGHLLCGEPVLSAQAEMPKEETSVAPVEKVESAEIVFRDADRDGVSNDRDHCPNTPAGVTVDEHGCGIDSDGDGVPDHRDECPDTPSGVVVDTTGCPFVKSEVREVPDTAREVEVPEVSALSTVNFATDSTELIASARAILDDLAAQLRAAPETQVMIVGHTDSRASDEYNDMLSTRRARSVADYLISRGIASERLTEVIGKGERYPKENNNTDEGRYQNRRVEITVE